MKALLGVALILALGTAALFFFLDADTERGKSPVPREFHEATPTPPAATATRDPSPSPPPGGQPNETRRASVTSGEAPAARSIFEGAVTGGGSPIPGARVELSLDTDVIASSKTDENGRFRLETRALSAMATLHVAARGFVSLERKVQGRPVGGTVPLGNLRVVRGQRVVGRVVDERGAGIPDATLRAEPTNPGSDRLVSLGNSGPDGAFELADAPPGTILVTARAKGFGEQQVQYSQAVQPFEIRLEPGMDLFVALRTPLGEPIVGAEVSIQIQSKPRSPRRDAKSDSQGRVAFEGLGAPAWTVRVTHPEYRPAGRGVQATGTLEVIECLPWPCIDGVVRAPGGKPPPPGTVVHALPASAPSDRVGALSGGTPVEADGHFRVKGLRAGAWKVLATAPGFAPTSSNTIMLGIDGDGYAGTLELSSGGKLLVVVTKDDGPLAGALVGTFASAPTPAQLWALANSPGTGREVRATSDPDGRALLENLAPGRLWIAVFAEGSPPRSSGPHEPTPGSPAVPIEVELLRGVRVHGRALSHQGAPVALAQLRLLETTNKIGFPLTLVCDEDGRYTSSWLPPGHYTIEAFAPDAPTRRSPTYEFDLEPGEQRLQDLQL